MFGGDNEIELVAAFVQEPFSNSDSLAEGVRPWEVASRYASDFQLSLQRRCFEFDSFSVGSISSSISEIPTQAAENFPHSAPVSEQNGFTNLELDCDRMEALGDGTIAECAAARQWILSSTSTMPSDKASSSTVDTPLSGSFASFYQETLISPALPDLDGLEKGQARSCTLHDSLLDSQPFIAPQYAVGPQRKPSQPRQSCATCGATFSRPSDLKRHRDDIHEMGTVVYKCNFSGCKHGKFGRLDKIKEHCARQRHGSYSIIEVAANPEIASALHASCRRKNVQYLAQRL